MRKFIILFIVAIVMSCNQKKSQDIFCLKKIEYINQREKIIPSIVEIQIEDVNRFLEKKILSGKLKNVILYSLKETDRNFLYLTPFGTGKQFKIENSIITLPIITTLFEKDLGNTLSNQEINKRINGDVGLVFDRDTIIIKQCNE
ncbi:MAG TPA: hypothetical protein PLD18_08465 [Flavobacterium sp.]|mgnify:FL=1|nr:hypothetical protein [Flavobacterium sp.]HRA73353.1 hypothetical protein [Flavobacterium sp.]